MKASKLPPVRFYRKVSWWQAALLIIAVSGVNINLIRFITQGSVRDSISLSFLIGDNIGLAATSACLTFLVKEDMGEYALYLKPKWHLLVFLLAVLLGGSYQVVPLIFGDEEKRAFSM